MFMWTVSKRRFIGLLCIAFAITVVIGLFLNENMSVAKTNRKLPIYSVDTTNKKIAITFDAAWTNQDTQDLIDILKKHNAKATFFIVGDWAEKFPESVKAFYDAGHTIANHSDTHKAFSKCSREEIRKEIINCKNMFFTLEIIISEKQKTCNIYLIKKSTMHIYKNKQKQT